MGSIYDRAAIRFRVKTEGKPIGHIPMAMGLECYDGTSAWAGFDSKMIQGEEISSEWTDIIVPILAFNWGEMDADISNIKQLQMEFQASGNLYLDNIEIIEYDKSLKNRGNIILKDKWNSDELRNSKVYVDEKPFMLEDSEVFLRMDSTHLYVNASVIDDTPLQNSKLGEDIWNGDAVEIALSSNVDAPLGRTFYMTTDKHFGIRASDDPIVWDWEQERELEGCDIDIKKNSTGYILNARIPFKELGIENEFEPRSLYGIEIAIDQGDKDQRTRQIRWNSLDVEGFHRSPFLWGEARIIKY